MTCPSRCTTLYVSATGTALAWRRGGAEPEGQDCIAAGAGGLYPKALWGRTWLYPCRRRDRHPFPQKHLRLTQLPDDPLRRIPLLAHSCLLPQNRKPAQILTQDLDQCSGGASPPMMLLWSANIRETEDGHSRRGPGPGQALRVKEELAGGDHSTTIADAWKSALFLDGHQTRPS